MVGKFWINLYTNASHPGKKNKAKVELQRPR
ncbi:hypothetical protein CFP56_038846 [Quercus suber]|uniref:Uncharacterized protein n=1 Tax=Quercus suber TaxID=58331 RepID=A0AAW0LNI7_QUESU